MARKTANKIDIDIQLIELGRLEVSPHNVRKVEINDLEGLVASIQAVGLLQPLVGYYEDGDPDGRVKVAAGQRRLLALRQAGYVNQDIIPIRILDEMLAVEASLAENLERKDMNPADEARGFKALLNSGTHNAETIAKRFGLTTAHVKRRLKIADLAPEILEALQSGVINTSSAEAYAATDEHSIQRKIFKTQCRPNVWQAHSPAVVIREIETYGIRADSRLGMFIGGTRAYRKAGGMVERDEAFTDLFKEHSWNPKAVRFLDGEIVTALTEKAKDKATRKLDAELKESQPFAARWEWMANLDKNTLPKPPKGSDLVKVEASTPSTNYRDGKTVRKMVVKAAEKHGAVVVAVACLDEDGKPCLSDRAWLVGREGWKQATPKQDSGSDYKPMTDEERAAANRERQINDIAANLYGRTLVGETPHLGVTRCYFGYNGELKLELSTIDNELPNTLEEFEAARSQHVEEATRRIEQMEKEEDARVQQMKEEAKAEEERERDEYMEDCAEREAATEPPEEEAVNA